MSNRTVVYYGNRLYGLFFAILALFLLGLFLIEVLILFHKWIVPIELDKSGTGICNTLTLLFFPLPAAILMISLSKAFGVNVGINEDYYVIKEWYGTIRSVPLERPLKLTNRLILYSRGKFVLSLPYRKVIALYLKDNIITISNINKVDLELISSQIEEFLRCET